MHLQPQHHLPRPGAAFDAVGGAVGHGAFEVRPVHRGMPRLFGPPQGACHARTGIIESSRTSLSTDACFATEQHGFRPAQNSFAELFRNLAHRSGILQGL